MYTALIKTLTIDSCDEASRRSRWSTLGHRQAIEGVTQRKVKLKHIRRSLLNLSKTLGSEDRVAALLCWMETTNHVAHLRISTSLRTIGLFSNSKIGDWFRSTGLKNSRK